MKVKVKVKKNILLVEDEFLVAMGEQQELEKYGYTVKHVNTGEKAVNIVNEKNEIDLILMDIDLGKGIDGTEAAALILKDHDLPIVFLSSHIESEIVEKTEKITSYGYVVKNSSITVLDASIKMAFKLFAANKQIFESGEKYHNLFTNTDEGVAIHEIVLDKSGKPIDYIFLDVNEAFETNTGFLKADILGRRVTEVIPGIEKSSFIKIYGNVVKTGTPLRFEQYSEQLERHYSINAYRVASGQFATAFTDITEIKYKEEQLRKLSIVTEQSPEAIVITNVQGEIEYINPKFNILSGYTLKELKGKNQRILQSGETSNSVYKDLWETINSGKIWYGELLNKKENGDTYWESEIISPIFDKNKKITNFIGIKKDVTKSRQAKILLNQYKHMVSNSSDLQAFLDKDFNYIVVNKAYSDSFNLTPDYFIGKNTIDIFGKDYFNKVIKPNADRCLSGEEVIFQNWYDFPAYGQRFINLIYSPYRNENNEIMGYVVNGRDNTEKKQIENNLKTNLHYLTKSQEMGKIGTWELDLQNNILNWTDENYKIFGIPLETKTTYEYFLNHIHPDDRDYVNENWKAALNNEPYDIEHRIIVNDEVKWIREKAEVKFDKTGNPISAIGFTQDITEFKLIKDELVKSELLLRSSIESPSDMIILSIDKEYRYLYFNQNHKGGMLAAYNNDVEIGMNLLDCLTSKIDKKNAKVNFDRALAGESHSTIQEYGDSQRLYFEFRYNPIFDKDGNIIGATAFAFNITKRKQMEDEIKHQLLEKEIILKEVNHRMKNNLTSIGSILSLQAQSSNNPEVQLTLNDAIGRINGMQILYERLLISNEYTATSVKDYFNNLIDEIINLLSNNQIITIEKNIENIKIDTKELFPLGIILNEMLTNTLKYAFIGRDSGSIEISIKENKGNMILSVQDNGNGLPEGFNISKSKGFGLRLIKMLSQQLGGSFSMSNHIGTKSVIKFSI